MEKSSYELMMENSKLFRYSLEAKNIEVDDRWVFNVQRSTISCELRKAPPTISTYFGSSVILRNTLNFISLNNHLTIGVGSSGSFNKEDHATVEKHLLTAIFIQNFDELEKIVDEHCTRVKLEEEQRWLSRHNN